MEAQFISTNGIRLHTLHCGSKGPVLLLMHGLTANAHAFDGLLKEGLCEDLTICSVDLRGRGLSDQPLDDYSMAAHAKDIVGLMEEMRLSQVILGGHSFGGLLSLYMAFHYPEKVQRLILLDAAARMHHNTREMLGPALSRLGRRFPSFENYINEVRSAPYMDAWTDDMLSYYAADVQTMEDHSVMPVPQPANMVQAVNAVLSEPWEKMMNQIEQPALLINGTGIYTMGAALLPEENARATAAMLPHCQYVKVPGNHQTMLYNEGAKAIVTAIREFLKTTT
jgi:pimeloyl-ACP methyl ester carboxylesterase